MKEQEVYVKVSVDDELPEVGSKFITIDTDGFSYDWKRTIRDEEQSRKIFANRKITHYLKPTTGILLTKEELVKLIMDFTEKYSEGKGTKFLREKGLL